MKEPSEAGYYEAIKAGLGKTSEQIRLLRMLAWWRRNDPFRHPEPEHAKPEMTAECQENLEALWALLPEVNEDEGLMLMKAEVARHLGRFTEARNILALPYSPKCRHAARAISDLCDQRRTDVAIVRGDEGFTEEERAKRKQQIEQDQAEQAAFEKERRARLESEYQEMRKGELARVAAATREGQLCPKCGFSYKWDGLRCEHCQYQVARDEGLSAEEKERLIIQRAEPVRREKDRRARLQQQEERAEEEKKEVVAAAIREGKLCPKCGFADGWDGVHCGHYLHQASG